MICKKKKDKAELLRFIVLAVTALNEDKQSKEIVIDINNKLKCRGYYFCDDNDCHKYLDNWINRKTKNKGK
ncbi:MAG: DUF448 domain-containing protein [Candidatus Cloacimonetes bacterium]|nr:DUF448 domain-containing protein [Candidatus Cloacimonadota bacterium]